jgi:hypothetical protein
MRSLFVACLIVLGCSGAAAADTRVIAVQNLLELDASGPFRIEISAGPISSAVLEGPTAELNRLESRVTDRGLQVRAKGVAFRSGNGDIDVVLRITTPILQAITVSKGAEGAATGLNTSALKLDVSMGALLKVAGQCNGLEADARMGGALDAEGLICRDVSAHASMGGSVQVHATQSIKAGASMGGSIEVTGNPPRRDISSSMGGAVDTH